MKKEETIQVPAHNKLKVTYICDACGQESMIYRCHMCHGDVCYDCAIKTDHWNLEDGEYIGDRPDYYCPSCWEKGELIRAQIRKVRDEEEELWSKWRISCKGEDGSKDK